VALRREGEHPEIRTLSTECFMLAGRLGSFVSARILWLSAWLIRHTRLAGPAALFVIVVVEG
jgi:hypothetical protein